ncbi:MAG: hypothetical protein CL908_15815 [Deltaproteobacteria bacterium]|nr:hypothetical protein [Deltaproteobacteria bacterium]
MKRVLRIGLPLVLGLVGVGLLAFRLWRGPDPETILANIDVPPSPVLSAEEELATFRTAPDFRVELVAAEPLIVDPVAMDWDDEGRLYVVEMRGFMGDINGGGEDRPVGRVVVLEDTDHDGRMDQSRVFLEGLVMPRAIAVLPEGILIGVPPDLLLCRDSNADLRCNEAEKQRLTHYAAGPGNVEHRENGLLPGIDGWIYNAKSNRRFRLDRSDNGDEVGLEIGETIPRGQWGIAQDDQGRLYYNHNSGFLYVDTFPAEYTLRQAATATQLNRPGINVDLGGGEEVWGVRVAAGLNRADQPGTLRPNGHQKGPTAISGLVIQRGDQYGTDYRGDAFVPEAGGSALSRFSIAFDGATPRATHHLYDDPDFGHREFIASSDERFRPVDARVGPDGAIWVIDMYRGVIQHAQFVSDHLRAYVEAHDLAPPGETGRIWRVVRSDRPIDYTAAPLSTLEAQLRGLDHANGWVRDRAQRRLVFERNVAAASSLRDSRRFSDRGRVHALWTLEGLGALDADTWRVAVHSDSESLRRTALRVGESLLPDQSDAFRAAAIRLLDDPELGVRLQALHSLGALPAAKRPVGRLAALAREGGPLERQAALSSLSGLERETLDTELTRDGEADPAWIRALTTASFLAAQHATDAPQTVVGILDRITERDEDELALAMIEGIRDAQELPANMRVVLPAAHPLFDDAPTDSERGEAVARIRLGFTWNGDPSPGGARPLTSEEEETRERGARLFAATCASCHGEHGRGHAGLAPPLVGSSWVRDADAWLVRIALHGLRGPIEVRGEQWNRVMPGHGHDPRFDDDTLAGLLTHLRRSWGHADRPISRETVARIRAETTDHSGPWTTDELMALPVDHRLDRFTGIYRIPIVGVELRVGRQGARLDIGRGEAGRGELREVADGIFAGQGVHLRFDPTIEGPAPEAKLAFGDQSVVATRVGD